MNSKEILDILYNDEYVKSMNFLGVFPVDRIPNTALSFPCCGVVNTKPHNHRGEHWVCFFKTSENKAVYFDSFGYPPYNLEEIAEVLSSADEYVFNDTHLQTAYSTVCGQYTIFVLTHLARGFTLEHIIHLIDDCGDTMANDAFIFNYIKHKYVDFNSNHLQIVDLPFIFDQAAYAY